MAKIFVGGLNWDTTDDAFKTFFATYGEIEESIIMRDRLSGTSRGFGFVTFKEATSVDEVLRAGELELDGRKVDCKAAVPREDIGQPGQMAPARTKKIFIGGLLPEVGEADLKEYFGAYGEISEAIIMMDRVTNRSRGFGFVTYDNEESVDKVCASTTHELRGKAVECKRAVPKTKMGGPAGYGPMARGGRGGPPGRGGYGGRGGPPAPGGYGGYNTYGAGGYGGYPRAPAPYAAPADAYYGAYPGYEAAAGAAAVAAYGYEGYDAYGAAAAAQAAAPQGYGAYEGMRSSRGERSYHPYR